VIQEIFGKNSSMPYTPDNTADAMKKYRQWFKNTCLWKR